MRIYMSNPTKEGYHKVKQLKPFHLGKRVKYLDKVEGIFKFLKDHPNYTSSEIDESILKRKEYQVYSFGILDTILENGKTGNIKEQKQKNKEFYTMVNVKDIYIPNEIQDHYKEEEPHPTYINKVTRRLSQLTRRRSRSSSSSSSSSSSKKIRGRNSMVDSLLKPKPKP
jgi:hypothetical protein